MTLITFLVWSVTCAIFSFMVHKLFSAHKSESCRLLEVIDSEKIENDALQKKVDYLVERNRELEKTIWHSEEYKKILIESLNKEIYKNKFLRY